MGLVKPHKLFLKIKKNYFKLLKSEDRGRRVCQRGNPIPSSEVGEEDHELRNAAVSRNSVYSQQKTGATVLGHKELNSANSPNEQEKLSPQSFQKGRQPTDILVLSW